MLGYEAWLRGVWVAMVTPWDEVRARPRRESVRQLVRRFACAGIDGLFILGTTGEGFLFSTEERRLFAEVVLEEAEGSLPVIVHVGHDATNVVVELAQHAQKVGACAVSLAAPSRYRLDEVELERHFITVAEAVKELPVLLYDIPSSGCNDLGAAILVRVREKAPNVVGAKVSRADWRAWEDYLKLQGSCVLLVGNDLLCLPLLLMGAVGIVSGPANVFPDLYAQLFRKVWEKDVESAVRYQRQISKLCEVVHYGEPLAYIKEALRQLGWDVGEVRPPLRSLNPKERERLRIALEGLAQAEEKLGKKGGDQTEVKRKERAAWCRRNGSGEIA